MLLVIGQRQSHIIICCAGALYGKVDDLAQPMFECPFCAAPAWRTRYMLWKHMHECMRKKMFEQVVDVKTKDAIAVMAVTP